jgi:tetratricopeptide (TPR) repeat protein
MVTAGILVYERFSKNPEQIVPYPYVFEKEAPSIALEAPILITGDRMGVYFAKFKEQLALSISVNLAKPIKIQSMAKNGNGIHRTIHELRSLQQWPQILIYQGGSEEFSESKFKMDDIHLVKENFNRYNDDRIGTMLILYPWLSRLVYEPIKRIALEEEPILNTSDEEAVYLNGLETELLLYEQQLIELATLSKDRNSLLILTTTPINLDILPRKVCEFTSNMEIDKEIFALRKVLKANDPKNAYSKSSKLVKKYAGNAELYYLHGQISKQIGKLDEAKSALRQASAYDCTPWRVTEIHNSIIRKVARKHQILLFDFASMVESSYTLNTTFFDELHPQNLYYDKGMEQLGLIIKSILKL